MNNDSVCNSVFYENKIIIKLISLKLDEKNNKKTPKLDSHNVATADMN